MRLKEKSPSLDRVSLDLVLVPSLKWTYPLCWQVWKSVQSRVFFISSKSIQLFHFVKERSRITLLIFSVALLHTACFSKIEQPCFSHYDASMTWNRTEKPMTVKTRSSHTTMLTFGFLWWTPAWGMWIVRAVGVIVREAPLYGDGFSINGTTRCYGKLMMY